MRQKRRKAQAALSAAAKTGVEYLLTAIGGISALSMACNGLHPLTTAKWPLVRHIHLPDKSAG